MLAARRRPPLVLFCVGFLLGPSALSFQVIGVFWDGGWACGWAVVGACACAALFSLWVKFRKRMIKSTKIAKERAFVITEVREVVHQQTLRHSNGRLAPVMTILK